MAHMKCAALLIIGVNIVYLRVDFTARRLVLFRNVFFILHVH